MELWLFNSILSSAIDILHGNARWMSWNMFLAIVPLVLSVLLFRQTRLGSSAVTVPPISLKTRHRSWIWWVGVGAFIAFLPNAPYLLTDVIHFIDDVQMYGGDVWLVTFVLIPLYGLFIFAGFEAYVLSLINVGYYLNQRGLRRYVLGMELAMHLLNAIGIYLGRFLRFNSWDILTRPGHLALTIADELIGKRPMLAIVITFLLVSVLYFPVKEINLAIAAYRKPHSKRLKSLNS
jgi:uncharacterized membrane protein